MDLYQKVELNRIDKGNNDNCRFHVFLRLMFSENLSDMIFISQLMSC